MTFTFDVNHHGRTTNGTLAYDEISKAAYRANKPWKMVAATELAETRALLRELLDSAKKAIKDPAPVRAWDRLNRAVNAADPDLRQVSHDRDADEEIDYSKLTFKEIAQSPPRPILKPHRLGARDWEEDFEHENGNYLNRCTQCGVQFMGYKRRCVCKVCAERPDLFVMVEASGGDQVFRGVPMVRFQTTPDGDEEREHLIYLHPQDDGSVSLTFGPEAEVELHDNRHILVKWKKSS